MEFGYVHLCNGIGSSSLNSPICLQINNDVKNLNTLQLSAATYTGLFMLLATNAVWYVPIIFIMPPLSTTPSAPTKTMSTSSMLYATAESIKSFTGMSSLASSLDNRNPVLSGLPSAFQLSNIKLTCFFQGGKNYQSIDFVQMNLLIYTNRKQYKYRRIEPIYGSFIQVTVVDCHYPKPGSQSIRIKLNANFHIISRVIQRFQTPREREKEREGTFLWKRHEMQS